MTDEIFDKELSEINRDIADDVFRGQRVLVTGGAGFLGSWLCEYLLGKGANVVCVDDFSTGMPNNISLLSTHKNFSLSKLSVTELDHPSDLDLILHFASRASPLEYRTQPVETLRANSEGTRRVLEMARKNDSKVFFSSTSEVYGDALVIPTPESYWGNVNPVGERSCYDEGKRFGEALCMAYMQQYGVDCRVARIFNTYGPRLRADGLYGRAISRFIRQAVSGEPLTIFGDGSQTRSFCYVSDLINGILRATLCKSLRGTVFNLGGEDETTILKLAETIKGLIKTSSQIVFQDEMKDDPKRRRPDLNEVRKHISWKPQVGLPEGLSRTIQYLKPFFN